MWMTVGLEHLQGKQSYDSKIITMMRVALEFSSGNQNENQISMTRILADKAGQQPCEAAGSNVIPFLDRQQINRLSF